MSEVANKCPDCGGLPGLYPDSRCPACHVKRQHQSDPLLPDIDKRIGDILDGLMFDQEGIPADEEFLLKRKQQTKSEIIRMLEGLKREAKPCHFHGTFEIDSEAIPLTALDDLIGRLK